MSSSQKKKVKREARSTPLPVAQPRPSRPVPAARAGERPIFFLLLPGLFLIVLLAYHPAWHGGMLWDDDAHITRSELRSAHGLWRIWFDPGATQQYYPLAHSVFWTEFKLWGDNTLGYHILNIGLHAVSAFLLALILRRLAVPGAMLAAALFALHPVQVESVAWMTELKNTLSGVFYFAAALAYLCFDRSRTKRLYLTAMALFVAALLSKTVTATLPAGLLVVFWRQRGRLDWRRDIVPLIPFFVVGAAAGLATAWVERTVIGARGREFDLGLIERALVAGRAVIFYIGTLMWPAHLTFIYPRWTVSAGVAWQYLFPIAVAGLLAASWFVRRRTRAPFAALSYFLITAFPALGFLNVYPFRYSFVADHFQYLASAGIIALVASSLVRSARRWIGGSTAAAEAAMVLALSTPLALVTRQQSRQYVDAETLYRETLHRNPECWLCLENLGVLTLHQSDSNREDAVAYFQRALEHNPDEPQVHNNLGTTLWQMGRHEQALAEHREAVRLAPGYAEAHGNLGSDLQTLGRFEEAAEAYRDALAIKPGLTFARFNLGVVLNTLNRPQEAAIELREAVKLDPRHVDAHNALGDALVRMGRPEEAIGQYREASQIDPAAPRSYANLGSALISLGRFTEAIAPLETALRLDPGAAKTLADSGYALWRGGRLEEAADRLRQAVQLQPGDAAAHDNLGNVLQALQRLDEAVAEYNQALALESGTGVAEIHNDLGVALARLGRRADAIAQFREALRLKPEFPAAAANLARAVAGPK